jgi:putative hemolysin
MLLGLVVVVIIAIIVGFIISDGKETEETSQLPEPSPTQTSQQTNTADSVQIANPASSYCINQGGRSDIRSSSDGSQVGYCVFDNGKECEEWAYFRDECSIDQ